MDPALQKAVHQKWAHYTAHYVAAGPDRPAALRDTAQTWDAVVDFMRIPPIDQPPRHHDEHTLHAIKRAVQAMTEKRLMPATLDILHHDLQDHEPELQAEIDAHMRRWETSRNPRDIYVFVSRLCEIHTAWCPSPILGAVFPHRYHRNFVTVVHSMLPASFAPGLRALLTHALTNSPLPPDPAGDPALPPCLFPHPPLAALSLQHPNPVVTAGPPSPYAPVLGALDVLGFLDRYEAQLTAAVYALIDRRIRATCPAVWDAQLLPELRDWFAAHVVPWLARPYARGLANPEEARLVVAGVVTRFEYHLCRTLCALRMSELFDIIVDYPDSMPALLDIKECLAKVDQRLELVKALRRLNNRRLLHPGADTRDILTQYVSTIRCLRVIDPPGVLLYKVADPIRRYLRARPDTIRNIVASLVGEGGELLDEHEAAAPQPAAEDYSEPNWEPEPIDAGPDFRANKPADVLTTLVSIYDSKDLFVRELQVLLAQRLLAIQDGNFDRERKNIEILKLRFGDAPLQVCEVMLRDMTDSRRIDQHIQAQTPTVVHPTIISRNFWPALQPGGLKLPGQYQALQDAYARAFAQFKPDKQLRWLPHLGTVHLELALRDRTVAAAATPLEAAVAELFAEQAVWTVDALRARLGAVARAPAVAALAAWVDRGVLAEAPAGRYTLLEEAQPRAEAGAAAEPDAEADAGPRAPEAEDTVATVQQQQAAQMRIYWKFVQGMLTNVGALPLERVHAMLKFAPGYDRTPPELAAYLDSARREGLVALKDGLWSLTPNGRAG